ncbi:hypothetical protein [Streptomyces sp. SP18BB07]|uniref:hypothetical protein n=1 Tax=Streptomyces sp. SP18BB07 TaxID=3002522 RepID=UPI002E774CC6|nr:hypothetical protein [Streptomyces sp. SP18BB07]MEE1758856.1 hypothetical protein [Streptomyces sp. SP18BB07]
MLEDALSVILEEIETRAGEDAQSREREKKARAEGEVRGGRPWRKPLFGINSQVCFRRRPDAGRKPPYSVPTAMPWNVVLPNCAVLWTS